MVMKVAICKECGDKDAEDDEDDVEDVDGDDQDNDDGDEEEGGGEDGVSHLFHFVAVKSPHTCSSHGFNQGPG